jgi:hypothetical protein
MQYMSFSVDNFWQLSCLKLTRTHISDTRDFDTSEKRLNMLLDVRFVSGIAYIKNNARRQHRSKVGEAG